MAIGISTAPISPTLSIQLNSLSAWQDDRNGHWDIYGYNLTTEREFRITDDPYDQTHPAISGDVVVWQDNRTGKWNIYAVILNGTEVAQCASWLPSDVNGDCKINFADVAVMAASWLECDLDPPQACSQ
jgi:beta propeller repeat protein